jgi:hypothetical protein
LALKYAKNTLINKIRQFNITLNAIKKFYM